LGPPGARKGPGEGRDNERTMFGTVFRKELLDQILSPKFLIVSLLCLVLIPVSLVLNYASYRSAYREYDSSQREAKATTTVFREPSVLSTDRKSVV
jgi:hypothetical protein